MNPIKSVCHCISSLISIVLKVSWGSGGFFIVRQPCPSVGYLYLAWSDGRAILIAAGRAAEPVNMLSSLLCKWHRTPVPFLSYRWYGSAVAVYYLQLTNSATSGIVKMKDIRIEEETTGKISNYGVFNLRY